MIWLQKVAAQLTPEQQLLYAHQMHEAWHRIHVNPCAMAHKKQAYTARSNPFQRGMELLAGAD